MFQVRAVSTHFLMVGEVHAFMRWQASRILHNERDLLHIAVDLWDFR
jgi:hypothetical protein